jgi:hypothetical protein
VAESEGRSKTIGDTVPLTPDLTFSAEVPVAATLRLVRDGKEVAKAEGRSLKYKANAPGVYRLEVSLPVAGEERAWIYTGAILVR